MAREQGSAFDRDYPWLDAEGDCRMCEGTGGIVCNSCEGSGCRNCLDGERTCGECGGSGYSPPVEPLDEE